MKSTYDQGDQIGRIFAHWAIVFFGKFKNYKVGQIFWATFYHSKCFVLILTKMGWAKFWAIFSQTHVTLLTRARTIITITLE
jgi:hypothetical protein